MSYQHAEVSRRAFVCAAAIGAACLAVASGGARADDVSGATAGATAPNSYVQMYGLIGMYVARSKLSTSSASTIQEGGGGMTTSFWGVRGREDLGGGNAVIFALESFFRPNTGQMGRNTTDGFFSRNAYVGLSSPYGTFKIGEQTNPTYINQQLVNPLGSSVVFSPLIVQSYTASYNNTEIGDTVWRNAVEYVSPRYLGLTGTVMYGVSSTTGHQGHDNVGIHLNYANGPFLAVFSAQRVRTAAVALTTGQYLYLVGASYDAKVVKLYGAAQMTSDTAVQTGSHTYELGVSVPLSPSNMILAEWARTRHSAPLDASSVRNTGTIAYDHLLSKRTYVYAVYSYDKLSGSPSGSTVGVGIQHTF
ncbi:porin [Trinickia caryophylli]|uniref:Outer membrane protein (Porin) n=1 Tax=Trinickia caryophylli TaxID=28094 RepID=A0A1X7GK74_TRICW|nr:porin [Trinickia caryophylli]PMS09168.1 porin [Trinickia caryophylli]TRX14975.1 porin [Trinickia caryophylli]WQE14831.1 porin [Trinickia caryophylli]SMF70881.1 Outer membrane protein (porin) [Trinickia caryophylli]GLU35035.1 porin [Trinickia caryophylli]